jgi:ribokinase
MPRDSISASSDLDSVASAFIRKGVASVIITLGAEGVYYQTVSRHRKSTPGKRLPAAKAKVVDTTAAGDTFVGAFAVGLATPSALSDKAKDLSHDEIIDESVAFAIRASGKTVEKAGAQKSIPRFDEVPQAKET